MPPPLARIALGNTVRLIRNAHLLPSALGKLADTHGETEDLAELESGTNARLIAEHGGFLDLHPGELVRGIHNATLINAAFAHTRPGGSRFNEETRGAWYCATSVDTALAGVIFHITRFLAEANNSFDQSIDYVELFAALDTDLHDLRTLDPTDAVLHPDTAVGYSAGQALARTLRGDHHSAGVVYPSVRDPDGTCFAIFVPRLVQNVRRGGTINVEWTGSPTPTVTC